MKSFFTLLACFAALLSSKAQDAQIFNVFPEKYSEVKSGFDNRFVFDVAILEEIPAEDTLRFYYAFDGNPFVEVPGVQVTQRALTTDDTLSFSSFLQSSGDYGDTLSLNLVCKFNSDINAANDTFSQEYIISRKTVNDLSVELVSPSSGETIKNWSTVDFDVVITNEGTNTFKSGEPLVYGLTIANRPAIDPAIRIYTGEDIEPGESANYTLSFGIPRAYPEGIYNMCINISWGRLEFDYGRSIESFIDDNEDCSSLEVVENSLSDIFENQISSRIENGQLYIGSEKELKNNNLRVYDVSGQLLMKSNVSLGASVQSFPVNASAGQMLFIELTDGNKSVFRKKVIAQ